MTDCEAIQERIPLVANGMAEWDVVEAAHLAACPACSAAWRTVAAARRLGDAAALRVDPARVNRAVLLNLASERTAARWRRGGWLAGLAAAAVLVLMVRVGPWHASGGAENSPTVSATLHVPLAELEALNAEELESVLDGLDEPLGAGSAPDAPHLGDLDDHQLERVLRSLEG
jgi:predicted anti-sigma-YlaC factor YlaD